MAAVAGLRTNPHVAPEERWGAGRASRAAFSCWAGQDAPRGRNADDVVLAGLLIRDGLLRTSAKDAAQDQQQAVVRHAHALRDDDRSVSCEDAVAKPHRVTPDAHEEERHEDARRVPLEPDGPHLLRGLGEADQADRHAGVAEGLHPGLLGDEAAQRLEANESLRRQGERHESCDQHADADDPLRLVDEVHPVLRGDVVLAFHVVEVEIHGAFLEAEVALFLEGFSWRAHWRAELPLLLEEQLHRGEVEEKPQDSRWQRGEEQPDVSEGDAIACPQHVTEDVERPQPRVQAGQAPGPSRLEHRLRESQRDAVRTDNAGEAKQHLERVRADVEHRGEVWPFFNSGLGAGRRTT
mmetsp:Transcript_33236/g.98727  ORF Transcript_33236/g.98727 Transcript_33236/m.98727 type:complete len:352 (+) Transcript_33236:233-1288(+)